MRSMSHRHLRHRASWLHEILTGRRLFKGEKRSSDHREGSPGDGAARPSLHNPLCPPEMDNIVLRALAKNPLERFQSASEMATPLTTSFTRPVSSLRNWPQLMGQPVSHRHRRGGAFVSSQRSQSSNRFGESLASQHERNATECSGSHSSRLGLIEASQVIHWKAGWARVEMVSLYSRSAVA